MGKHAQIFKDGAGITLFSDVCFFVAVTFGSCDWL
jgi:hypothetical protein